MTWAGRVSVPLANPLAAIPFPSRLGKVLGVPQIPQERVLMTNCMATRITSHCDAKGISPESKKDATRLRAIVANIGLPKNHLECRLADRRSWRWRLSHCAQQVGHSGRGFTPGCHSIRPTGEMSYGAAKPGLGRNAMTACAVQALSMISGSLQYGRDGDLCSQRTYKVEIRADRCHGSVRLTSPVCGFLISLWIDFHL